MHADVGRLWELLSYSVRRQSSTLCLGEIILRNSPTMIFRHLSTRIVMYSPSSAGARHLATAASQRAPVTLLSMNEIKRLSQASKDAIVESHETRHEGMKKYFQLQKQLRVTWNTTAKDASMSEPDLQSFFNAAKVLQVDFVVVKSLMELRERFPRHVRSKYYIDSKASFLRLKLFDQMIRIYEEATQSAEGNNVGSNAIFYVWAISAWKEANEVGKILDCVANMRRMGYMIPNDALSQVAYQLSLSGDRANVLAITRQVDPSMGIWTSQSLSRFMTACGIVKCPQQAFALYTASSLELDAKIFRTLLEICIRNRCLDEASDVLKNLPLFHQLKLDKGAYVTIIEALLILKRHDQIPIVLEEMRQVGISTDISESTKLRYLLKQCRNRSVTNNHHIYQPSTSTARMDSVLKSVVLPPAVTKLNDAVAKKDFTSALPWATELLEIKPFPPNVALENICMTMVETNRLDFIDMLLRRLQQERWPCPSQALFYLIRVFGHREKNEKSGLVTIRDPERTMAAYRAAKYHKLRILQLHKVIPVFLKLGAWEEATRELKAALMEHKNSNHFKRHRLDENEVMDVIRVCAKMQQYRALEDAITWLVDANYRVPIRTFCAHSFDPIKYSCIREFQQKKVVTQDVIKLATCVQAVLRLLIERQDLQPNWSLVDALANTLSVGRQPHLLRDMALAAHAQNASEVVEISENTLEKVLTVLLQSQHFDVMRHVFATHGQKNAQTYKNPELLMGRMAQSLAMEGKWEDLKRYLDMYPYVASFLHAMEEAIRQSAIEEAAAIAVQMSSYGLFPHTALLEKAMVACVNICHAKKKTIRGDQLVAAMRGLLAPLEKHVFHNADTNGSGHEKINVELVVRLKGTHPDGRNHLHIVARRDLERIYALGIEALMLADRDGEAAREALGVWTAHLAAIQSKS